MEPTVVATTNKLQQPYHDIRTGLQLQGALAHQEMSFTTLSTRGLSDVEKTKTKFYREGDYVTINPFTDEQGFFVAGIDRAGQRLVLQDRQGKNEWFALNDTRPFEVKKVQTLSIAEGEQLR